MFFFFSDVALVSNFDLSWLTMFDSISHTYCSQNCIRIVTPHVLVVWAGDIIYPHSHIVHVYLSISLLLAKKQHYLTHGILSLPLLCMTEGTIANPRPGQITW